MAKVSVGKTIAFSYGFTFGHIGAIIGRIWLPMLLLTLGGFFVISPYYESFSQAVAQDNTALVQQAVATLLIYMLISLIFYAMIYVALTKEALGISHSHSLLHFSLGAAEWRMYGAMLAFTFAFVIVMLLVVLTAGLLGSVVTGALGAAGLAPELATMAKTGTAPKVMSPAITAAGLLISLAIFCAGTYVFVRLFALLAPVTVAEEQISLGRGWQLTAKNFWRLFAVLLVTVGPVFVLVLIGEAVVIGPDAMVTNAGTSFADTAARMERMRPHLPALYGLSFVLSPFLFGLLLSASAFAYRTLVPPPAARAIITDVP